MSNEYDLCCPKCGHDHKFSIVASHTITVNGDDIDHDDSLTWDDTDPITCSACNHEGTIIEFTGG